MSNRLLAFAAAGLLTLAASTPLHAQIQRNPTGVNVNANGATTVFITFGNLEGYVPVEAVWCGELIPASPDLGDRCDSSTIFGSLPVRFDQSRFSGAAGAAVGGPPPPPPPDVPTARVAPGRVLPPVGRQNAGGLQGFTDIMSIPPSVARRAYQAAQAGADSRFFYVRRFVDPEGLLPDQYVSVTCRLTAGGARTPLALLDVRLAFAVEDPVLSVQAGEMPPPLEAIIAYNGTGRLVGRWEVVLPGEEPPAAEDLLTEATLPAELRGTQRRYTELERFNIFLPPTGEVVLPGPDPERLPTDADGLYQVLLRIEASDDKEGDTNLASAGAGAGIVNTGAVAGFPLPPLRYFVGDAPSAGLASGRLALLTPGPEAEVTAGVRLVFTWSQIASAVLYRLEVRKAGGDAALSAVVQPGSGAYLAPPWLLEENAGAALEWRVQALDGEGAVLEETAWRSLKGGAE